MDCFARGTIIERQPNCGYPTLSGFFRGEVKDPVLVAYDEVSTSYGTPQGNKYILARWADELDEWPALVNKAISKYKEQIKAKLQEIKTQILGDEQIIDSLTIESAKRGIPFYNW